MNSTQIFKTVFEAFLIVLLLLGIKYEPVLSAWEEKTFYKLLDMFKKR